MNHSNAGTENTWVFKVKLLFRENNKKEDYHENMTTEILKNGSAKSCFQISQFFL